LPPLLRISVGFRFSDLFSLDAPRELENDKK
jgi:hypothetical protein